jgi:transcriptional regulator with XRE-family HTH domain
VRVAACLTHEQVATRAGIHLRTVRNAEQGRRVPTLATRAKLAAALGVDPAAIAWSATTHREADR